MFSPHRASFGLDAFNALGLAFALRFMALIEVRSNLDLLDLSWFACMTSFSRFSHLVAQIASFCLIFAGSLCSIFPHQSNKDFKLGYGFLEFEGPQLLDPKSSKGAASSRCVSKKCDWIALFLHCFTFSNPMEHRGMFIAIRMWKLVSQLSQGSLTRRIPGRIFFPHVFFLRVNQEWQWHLWTNAQPV